MTRTLVWTVDYTIAVLLVASLLWPATWLHWVTFGIGALALAIMTIAAFVFVWAVMAGVTPTRNANTRNWRSVLIMLFVVLGYVALGWYIMAALQAILWVVTTTSSATLRQRLDAI